MTIKDKKLAHSNNISELENKLGYIFKNKKYIQVALTHRSYIVKKGANPNLYNQRLECLGDRVLGLIVLTHIYNSFPDKEEGYISKLASYLTSSALLLKISKDISLEKYIKRNGTSSEDSIFIDAMEALLAAIYLDSNYSLEIVSAVFLKFLNKYIDSYVKDNIYNNFNPKSYVQEFLQKKRIGMIPEYTDISHTGPDHKPDFIVELKVEGFDAVRGSGPNKKEAQKQAAIAFITMNNLKL